jgi:hypothetical protein
MLCACALALFVAGAIESDPELKKGQELMEAFEYEKAAVVFDTVAKRPGLVDADKAVALVWLGLAAAELRDTARASVAFEEAVTADPLISLPRDASPKIKTLLDDARARVRLKSRTTKPPTEVKPPDNGGGVVVPSEPPPPAGSGMMPIAIGTLVVGGVVAVAGGAIWGLGLALNQQAVEEPFQSRAAELRDQSIAAQIGGEVTLGVGALAIIAGGALLAVDAMD